MAEQMEYFSERDCLERWMTETCSIYRIGIVRIGVLQLVWGVLCILISGALMWLTYNDPWAVLAMACATMYLISGLVCIGRSRHGPKEKISPTTGMSLLATAAASFLSALSGYNIYGVLDTNKNTFPHQRLDDHTPLIIVNAVLLALSLLEFVTAVWAASLSMGIICMCCTIKRERVFTIPYDDTAEGELEAEPRGPDIVSRDPPRLQIAFFDEPLDSEAEEEEVNR